MHQVTQLPHGLTVVTSEMPYMASACLAVWVGVGARHEPGHLNGISHFIEHLLFKGTRRRNAQQITQEVEGVGGYLNAFTSEDNTCYYAKGPAVHWPLMLDVLMDMYLEPTFPSAEIRKERQVIQEEVSMYLDQPQQHVQDLLNQSLWPRHPLGRPITGTHRSVKAIRRPDLVQFQRNHYVGASSLLTIAGNISHEKVMRALARYDRRMHKGQVPQSLPVTNRQRTARTLYRRRSTAQTQLAIGFQCGSRHAPERHALRLLSTLVGENMSSRLYQVIREDHGLAYNISSSLNLFEDTGALDIYVGLDTDQLPKACRLLTRELKRLANTPPSAAELRRARDYLLGQLDLSLESTENRCMWLGEHFLGRGQILSPRSIRQKLMAVKPGQIRDLARQVFRSDRMSLAIICPLKKQPPVAQWLNLGGPGR